MQNKDAMIAELTRQIALLVDRVGELEKENVRLNEEIARLKKNSGNSSKPPSSDIVKPPKAKPSGRRKRKRGGQTGHAKHERRPFPEDQVDEVFEYELSKEDATGLEPLSDWHVIQQIELVDRPFVVTEHRARRYLDPLTGQVVITPLPAEIEKGGLVGVKFSALIGYQKSACHMSYSTIQTFLADVFGLSLSRGQLAKVVQKASTALEAPYDELRDALADQWHLGIDETGHKQCGQNLWTWCFRADDFTVFHIDPSRGSQVLREILGETFGGVIGCDYLSAYRAYMKDSGALAQFCMAHLIREIRFLAEHGSKWVADWARKLLSWLKKLFDTLHRGDQLTPRGFARSMDRIRKGFLKTARRPQSYSQAETLAKRFRGLAANHYFTFLTTPGVEPTNNLTEQAIRHVVIDRRVTQGTRGERGRHWCQRAWTVLATCSQQGRSAFEFLHAAILAHFNNQPAPSLLTINP